jgi:hypothetical protein
MKTFKFGCMVLALVATLGLASCATAPAPTPDAKGSAAVAPLAPDAVITWADNAWSTFQSEVPKAVQKIAKKQMEKEARDRGIALIDMDFYNEIKKEQGR